MNLKFPLRWKILVLTVVPLVILVVATLWTVNRNITRQVYANTGEDLQRASALFENMLASRARSIAISGEVIVRDPRFFSVLTLPGTVKDSMFGATVHGVASDFNSITGSDLFVVYGRRGELIASATRPPGPVKLPPGLINRALHNREVTSLMVGLDGHYQISLTPVLAGGHVVGVLLLGSLIDRRLAEELRGLTRSEVSFLSGYALTGTTLMQREDRNALIAALAEGGQLPAMFRVRGQAHDYLTLARAIPDAAPGRRQIYVMQRSLDAETAFLSKTQRVLGEIGALALLAALLAGYLISEHITSPVRRLVQVAEALERGNYDEPIDITTGDEIGYLAATLGDMRAHLKVYVSTLEEVTRLRSEFISIASHELRTPITIIRALQELMDAEELGPLTEDQKQALRRMDQSLTALTKIAEDATRMSLIESERFKLQPEECDVGSIVAEAIESAKASAVDRRVVLASEVAPGLPVARLDGARMTLALANLVRNGIRFTQDGGRVTVRAHADDETLVFEVEDTGVGMSEERRRRLYESAWHARPSDHHHSSSTLEFNSAGLGLGFSIARGIVEAHQGEIEVASVVGRGTVVTVRVPARLPEELIAA
jgi:signal transduction histidine kinase